VLLYNILRKKSLPVSLVGQFGRFFSGGETAAGEVFMRSPALRLLLSVSSLLLPPLLDDFLQDTRPDAYVRYDRFRREQLAGDLLCRTGRPGSIDRANQDSLWIPAGFNRCGPVHQTSDNVDLLLGRQLDTDKRLLARRNRRRLEGEALGDNALAVAGTLNPQLGGPMIRVPLEAEIYELIFTENEPDGLWPTTPIARQHTRRRLYPYNKRNVRLPLLEAFDQPDNLTSCSVRPTSTFAPQVLILLNGPFLREQAAALAARLLHESLSGERDCIKQTYRRPGESRAWRRTLSAAERVDPRSAAEGVARRWARWVDPGVDPARADFCLALFNRNEFLYVE
jgi:hypothetical protein